MIEEFNKIIDKKCKQRKKELDKYITKFTKKYKKALKSLGKK